MKNSSKLNAARSMALATIAAMGDLFRNFGTNFDNQNKGYAKVAKRKPFNAAPGAALAKKADEHNIGMGIHSRPAGAFPAPSLMGRRHKAARKRFYAR
jgi:hypothetical protein